MLGQQSSKEMEDLKAKFASAQSQLQSSKLLAEKLKAENQLLKQNNSTYEESLAKANSRINDISSWIVSTKFMKLMDDVSSLKELRGEMSVALSCNPVLKDVVASLTENENSISLKNLSSFAQVFLSIFYFISNVSFNFLSVLMAGNHHVCLISLKKFSF